MSDLDRFEMFAQVAQAKSITQAAKQLGVTKVALSKQIKRLEADLRIDLFTRYNQRLHLTEHGKVLLEQCLRLQKELDDARSICQQFHEEPTGNLHVVVFEYFAKQLIFPKLKTFLQRYPKLQLSIDLNERIPDFAKEQVDLAIGYSLQAPLDIVQKSMATTRYVICASPEYFTKHSKPHNLNDLQNHSYIEHRSRLENQMALKLKPGHVIALKPTLIVNRVISMIDCAKANLGLIQLPLYMLEDSLAAGELIEVLEQYQATDAHVYYYYPKYRYVQPKVRKFIDFFLK